MKQTVKLLGNVIERQSLSPDEATGLLKVITDYTYALDLLDQYDHQVLEIHDTTKDELFRINYHDAMQAIRFPHEHTYFLSMTCVIGRFRNDI